MKKIFAFAKEYWYLLVGMLLVVFLPNILAVAGAFVPIAGILAIFGVYEVGWEITFTGAVVVYGIGWLLTNSWRKTLARFSGRLRSWPTLVLVAGSHGLLLAILQTYFGLYSWYFWAGAFAPVAVVFFVALDDLHSTTEVFKEQLAAMRESARRNKVGKWLFYANRLIAFLQPNTVLLYLIWYRWQNPDWSLPAWVGNVVILSYVVLDNYSTWAFFRAFQLLIAPEKEEAKSKPPEVKGAYRVFRASQDIGKYGFASLRSLSNALEELDAAVWPEHQRAAPRSIWRRLLTSPDTCFVLVRQEKKQWLVVGALFARAINFSDHFPIGRTAFRVSWKTLERDGDFSPPANSDTLWTVGIMVRPGERRGAGGILEAALGGYGAAQGYKAVAGDSRLTGAAKVFKQEQSVSRLAFLQAYINRTDGRDWPVDPTLAKLIRGASVVILGHKVAQVLQIKGVTLDYFDDPESLDAAALVVWQNPLWWLPKPLRQIWGWVFRQLLSL